MERFGKSIKLNYIIFKSEIFIKNLGLVIIVVYINKYVFLH